MAQVTLRQQGDAVGIELPQDIRIRMDLEVGQQLTLIELHDGLKLVRHDTAIERQLDIAQKVLRDQANILRDLAEYDKH